MFSALLLVIITLCFRAKAFPLGDYGIVYMGIKHLCFSVQQATEGGSKVSFFPF